MATYGFGGRFRACSAASGSLAVVDSLHLHLEIDSFLKAPTILDRDREGLAHQFMAQALVDVVGLECDRDPEMYLSFVTVVAFP